VAVAALEPEATAWSEQTTVSLRSTAATVPLVPAICSLTLAATCETASRLQGKSFTESAAAGGKRRARKSLRGADLPLEPA
jgi:hypothetical protein